MCIPPQLLTSACVSGLQEVGSITWPMISVKLGIMKVKGDGGGRPTAVEWDQCLWPMAGHSVLEVIKWTEVIFQHSFIHSLTAIF